MRMLGLGVVSALSCLLSGALARAEAAAPDATPPLAESPPAASSTEPGSPVPPTDAGAPAKAAPKKPGAPGSPSEVQPASASAATDSQQPPAASFPPAAPLPAPAPAAAQPPPPPAQNQPATTTGNGVKVVSVNPFAPAVSSNQANTPAPVQDTPEQPKDFIPFKLAYGIEGGLGANGRIDGGPSGFAQKDRFDIALSLGVWSEPDRTWAYGLEYARTGLGGARSLPTAESVTVAYDLNTLWAKARYFALRETKYRGYAGLGLGLSIEEVRANGTHQSSMPFNVPPQVFACSAVSHPTVSLGAQAGMNVDLEQHLAFLFQVEAAAQPITGDVVGDCAVASGSVLNAVARLGFAYKFDAADIDEPKGNVARR
ncbi:MAG: hypothetical protein SFV15_11740 [Polyangiaceae bacterium]|nr:hypothetical protein [Polyangiaceae bacterium]